jgi:2-polyprenyl-3-methyl-5-hydroxy-6-metoxy-1,4-benzoquinol methylase
MRYAKDVLRAVYRYRETKLAVRCFPEFAEYFIPYAIKRSKYSSHYYASRLVGTSQRVLELRCGEGSFGAELVKAGNQVTGVDEQPHVPLSAGYRNVISVDLENGLETTQLHGLPEPNKFDRVLLMDVLEHLRDPNAVLETCKAALAERGRLLVSVPNAVNLTVRLRMLFGDFNYDSRGILDWAHLRFFTRRSIQRLLAQHGFKVRERHYTIMPLERVIPLGTDNAFLRAASEVLRVFTRLLPGLLAYEIVLLAER